MRLFVLCACWRSSRRWRNRSGCTAARRRRKPAASPAGSWRSRRNSIACCRTDPRGKADGSAAYTLLGISFIYGIFHAAGPGHGKAVISSYLVANDETWRRGVILSFASAILQALTAIVIVGIAAVLLGATAKVMGDTVRVIEMVSYGLIVLIGLRLLWVKGRSFLHLLRAEPRLRITGMIMATTTPWHDHAHHHGRMHDHDITRRGRSLGLGPCPCAGAERAQRSALAQARARGHRRCRTAALLGRHHRSGLRAGAGAVLDRRRLDLRHGSWHRHHRRRRRHHRGRRARFCRSARPGQARRRPDAVRGLETAAAAAIVLFGVALFTGYMASERMGLF